MPDLTAGSTILAQDTPPVDEDTDATDILLFANTTYAAGTPIVGVAFTAPTSGRVVVLFQAKFENNTVGVQANVSVAVREGTTLGSGTVHTAASDSHSLQWDGRTAAGTFRIITGLTPGSSYNAVTEQRVASSTGDIFDRSIAVLPLS